jgi:hypothetical protein
MGDAGPRYIGHHHARFRRTAERQASDAATCPMRARIFADIDVEKVYDVAVSDVERDSARDERKDKPNFLNKRISKRLFLVRSLA